jgi:uncharacterized protein YuzB (UPF0349 family)
VNGDKLIFKVWDKNEEQEYTLSNDDMKTEEGNELELPAIPPVFNATKTYGFLNLSIFSDPDSPEIDKIEPNEGTISGGTLITITGSNFVNGATVTFDDEDATELTVISDTKIQCKTPASDKVGAVDVTVINPDGQSGTLENGYTYIDDCPPIAIIHGIPSSPSNATELTLTISGECVVAYKYKLDNAAGYSEERGVATPINLTSLNEGEHTITLFHLNLWVQTFEFYSSIICCKMPINGFLSEVTFSFPSFCFTN